jgi:type IV secretory pathway VirB4 component
MPSGWNVFGDQFERVLPASSVANLYPFNYSGKTDSNGFYLGRDKFGSNILVDFNRRADDKTNANILILGNSGQGKSYLLKLILCNLRESGMHVICLDPEMEFEDLTNNLGGCFIDLMTGEYIINVLEPKTWDETGDPKDTEAPQAFRQTSKLSQHISFLKDFFRTYKDFNDRQIDTIEIMLGKLYDKWGISDHSNFDRLKATDYPILSDLYELVESEYKEFDESRRQLYTADTLREICLGLHSLCRGAESKFFNGHTNITGNEFVTFGVKGLLQASKNLRNALLFNVLSYMSNELLTTGNTAASIDEFYLFLSNLTAVEYVRNFMKRVRKKDSAVVLSSQNLEDFYLEGIREYTKPLFSIPAHAFLFNAGNIDKRFYMDTLQLEESEYNLIRYPQRGVCLYKCGNERYNLMVTAPEYKEKLFGKAGGR